MTHLDRLVAFCVARRTTFRLSAGFDEEDCRPFAYIETRDLHQGVQAPTIEGAAARVLAALRAQAEAKIADANAALAAIEGKLARD